MGDELVGLEVCPAGPAETGGFHYFVLPGGREGETAREVMGVCRHCGVRRVHFNYGAVRWAMWKMPRGRAES